MENSTFVTDAEVEEYIEGSLGDLYDIIVESAGPDLFLNTTQTHSTVAGTDTYTIYVTVGDQTPAPIYKIIDVQVQFNGDWKRVRPIQFWEELDQSSYDGGWQSENGVYYRCYVGSQEGPLVTGVDRSIRFHPTPQAVHSFRVRYIPTPGDWSTLGGGYSYMGFSGWDEFIVSDAAAKCLEKEESWNAAARQVARRDRAEGRVRRHVRSLNLDERETIRMPEADRYDLTKNPWADRLG